MKIPPASFINQMLAKFVCAYPFIEPILHSPFIKNLENKLSKWSPQNENQGASCGVNQCVIY